MRAQDERFLVISSAPPCSRRSTGHSSRRRHFDAAFHAQAIARSVFLYFLTMADERHARHFARRWCKHAMPIAYFPLSRERMTRQIRDFATAEKSRHVACRQSRHRTFRRRSADDFAAAIGARHAASKRRAYFI